MVSGLVLKDLNGECFVICGFYKYTLLASTEFNLTVPHFLKRDLIPTFKPKNFTRFVWRGYPQT